jgi:hypothetical protein
MALVEPDVMMNSIMGKIYNVLTNGDDTVPKSEDNFFSWATPGIPIEPGDFEFLTQGLTGVVKKAALEAVGVGAAAGGGGTAVATPSAPEITPALLESLRAQDTAKLYMQAESFARLVDIVPDVASSTNNKFAQLSVMNNEGSLSDRYDYTLRMSQVMEAELPEETKKKIEKFRALLTTVKKEKDLIDETIEVEVSGPSPMMIKYNEKMAAYENAALEYNLRRIEAAAADNTKAVHYWAMNANILRNKVRAALADWVNNGHKNDVEKISAFIDQVTQRDMALLKQQFRDDFEKAKLTGLASGSEFQYTAAVPGNFMNAGGWTEFGFTASDYNNASNSSYSFSRSSTSGGGGFLGIFGGRAAVSSARGESHSNMRFDSGHFGMSFKICQVPIVRPWFRSSFLLSKLWRFDQNNPEAKSQMISDGGNPPKGLIPAYPTSMICIKDLTLTLSKSSGFEEMHQSWQRQSAGGGAVVCWGPFHLGGSHARSSASGERSSNYHYDSQTQTMKVPGAQVIGFKCHLVPKSPDPLSSVTAWI